MLLQHSSHSQLNGAVVCLQKTTRPALSEYVDEDAKKVPREDCTLAYAQPQQQQQSLIHKQPNSKQQQDEGEQLKLEPR